MSISELEVVIQKIGSVQSTWGPDVTIEQIRADWEAMCEGAAVDLGARSEPVEAGGVPAAWLTARGAASERALLYLHGGGYTSGSIRSHRHLGERISGAADARVLLLGYRLAPEHHFPAPVEDALAAYRWLLRQGTPAERIAVAGDSAGGGLTLALMLALREAGDPLPACAALLSPWVDLECTGESYTTRADVDPIVGVELCRQMALAYLGEDGDARHPHAAPLNATFEHFPPLLIQVGEREVVLDDARAIAQQARDVGGSVQLDVWDGMIHQWHLWASQLEEGRRAIEELGAFVQRFAKI